MSSQRAGILKSIICGLFYLPVGLESLEHAWETFSNISVLSDGGTGQLHCF